MTWEYVSIVCEIVACPSISETIFGFTFFDSNRVAHVCRRKVKSESPAFSSSGLKSRSRDVVEVPQDVLVVCPVG